jgi:uncharacterized protein YkuJ
VRNYAAQRLMKEKTARNHQHIFIWSTGVKNCNVRFYYLSQIFTVKILSDDSKISSGFKIVKRLLFFHLDFERFSVSWRQIKLPQQSIAKRSDTFILNLYSSRTIHGLTAYCFHLMYKFPLQTAVIDYYYCCANKYHYYIG